MKRLIAAAIMVMFGCAMTSFAKDVKVDPEKNAVITVWESQGAEGEFIKYAGKEFEKEYAKFGVKVKYLPVESVKTIGQMQMTAQGGAAADVFVFPGDGLGSAVDSGIIMPNLVSADKITKEDIPAAVQAATYKDGKVYGFPMAIESIALFYNKKLLPAPPKTFEELLKEGVPFTDRDKNQFGLYCDIANFYTSYAFFAMEGMNLFGENGYDKNDIGLNSPAAIQALKDILTLKPMMFTTPPGKDQANAPMVGLFGEGKVMAIISGPWDVPRIKSSKIDFGIAPLPTFNGKHLVTFAGVRLMGVNPSSKCRKAAQLFAAYCTSPEVLKKRFEMTNQIPPVKSLMNEPSIKNNPLVKPFMEQTQYSKPMPSISEMKLIWDPMIAAITDAWTGKVTPKQALDNVEKTISDQIKLQES
jgi:arabinogalactan oligomer / maltooligosaccharide transport system substrate-binding protein